MYNNFLAEKNKKTQQRHSLLDKRLSKWLNHYRTTKRPQLVTSYTQRINTFITKLQKYEAPDIRQQKQQHIKQRMSMMEMKGGRMFRFRDTADFNSFYCEAERIQRNINRTLLQKKFGDTQMAYRSIASQSQYNPKTQFRSRDKTKEINPPMKYTNKISPQIFNHRKTKSSVDNRLKTQHYRGDIFKDDHQNMVRKSTSVSNSVFGSQLARSVTSMRADSQSSSDSGERNMKKFGIGFKDNKGKKKQSGKSYFVGISDLKLNTQDPHLRKTLHSILVKVGKNRPNPRDRTLMSHTEELSHQMN